MHLPVLLRILFLLLYAPRKKEKKKKKKKKNISLRVLHAQKLPFWRSKFPGTRVQK